MGFMSFLSEMLSMLLDKGPDEEAEITHSKFVKSIVDTLKSSKASNEDILQALRDLGAVVYVGKSSAARTHDVNGLLLLSLIHISEPTRPY